MARTLQQRLTDVESKLDSALVFLSRLRVLAGVRNTATGQDSRLVKDEVRKQSVVTPIPEKGIELDPETPGYLNVVNEIVRTWATLWGDSGQGNVRVKCNEQGLLITREPDVGKYKSKSDAYTADGTTHHVIDFGDVYNHLRYVTEAGTVDFEYSVDGSNYYGKGSSLRYYDSGSGTGIGEFNGSFRYARIYTNIDTAGDVYIHYTVTDFSTLA